MRLKAGAIAGVLAAATMYMYGGPASADVDRALGECHPSYQPCVPIAEDVDCASGEGDGPVWIDYLVHVVGEDEYGLDRDGNGIGCENEPGTGPLPEPEPEPELEPQPALVATPAAPVVARPTFTG